MEGYVMRQIAKLICLTPVIVSMIGCASTGAIRKGLNAGSYPLAYLHDQQTVQEKTDKKIFLEPVIDVAKNFSDSTEVVTLKSSVLPFLFYNSWKYEYECALGRSGIDDDLCSFVARSFREESNRSGRYDIAPLIEVCDYQLNITIDDHATISPYTEKGSLFFLVAGYAMHEEATAGPGVSRVTMTAVLSKGDSIIYRNSFHAEKTGFPLQKKYEKEKELRMALTNSMVESLSYACKNVIEQIVAEINAAIAATQ